jgi:peptide/nickel transport system substrate-binding protein
MSKKSLSTILLLFLIFSGFAQMASAHNAPFPFTYDPTHLIEDTISEPESLDPAWSYDTRSEEVIMQAYEPLIFFAVDYTQGPYQAGQVNQFVSKLATDLTIEPTRYVFQIRGLSGTHVLERTLGIPPGSPVGTDWHELSPWTSTNWRIDEWEDVDANHQLSAGDKLKFGRDCKNTAVYWRVYQHFDVNSVDPVNNQTTITEQLVNFHDGLHTLTTEDVEYSFERALVKDRYLGPMWMLYQPLLDVYGAVDPATDPFFGQKIDGAVESNATHVWLNVVKAYPCFLQILSQTWASIVNKEWCVAGGDFDGDWTHTWQYIWDHWHNQLFIADGMMGTGPYMFDYWVPGVSWSLVKFDDYWGGWPAQVEWPTRVNPLRHASFVSRVTWNLYTSWMTRRARFLAGDTDKTYVPRPSAGEVLGQIVGGEPIRCYYPISMLALDAFFFTYNINPGSPYLGPGFDPANPHIIVEDRIPVDFFSDIHMRRAFAYAFDYDNYVALTYSGEGERPATPVIDGLDYQNPVAQKYDLNMTAAMEELMQAWGGQVWANGMSFTIVYNSGNLVRRAVADYFATNFNALNPKFHIQVAEEDWVTYQAHMRDSWLPIFINGWTADFADVHNFLYSFMHSQGIFPMSQNYLLVSRLIDDLIEAALELPDDTNPYNGELDYPDPRPYFNNYPNIPPDTRWPKRSIYYWLQWLYYENAASVPLIQPLGRHWEQAWMRLWYYNPLYGGSLPPAIDSTAPEAPVEYVYHLWKAVTHFGDANNDGYVNIQDAAIVSASWTKPSPTSPLGPLGYDPKADLSGGTGGTPDGGVGLVVGIWDGKVNIADAALVSAYWDGPPQGPSHP